jgi:hypothetical protein
VRPTGVMHVQVEVVVNHQGLQWTVMLTAAVNAS